MHQHACQPSTLRSRLFQHVLRRSVAYLLRLRLETPEQMCLDAVSGLCKVWLGTAGLVELHLNTFVRLYLC